MGRNVSSHALGSPWLATSLPDRASEAERETTFEESWKHVTIELTAFSCPSSKPLWQTVDGGGSSYNWRTEGRRRSCGLGFQDYTGKLHGHVCGQTINVTGWLGLLLDKIDYCWTSRCRHPELQKLSKLVFTKLRQITPLIPRLLPHQF
jgi:hypothetical protein